MQKITKKDNEVLSEKFPNNTKSKITAELKEKSKESAGRSNLLNNSSIHQTTVIDVSCCD